MSNEHPASSPPPGPGARQSPLHAWHVHHGGGAEALIDSCEAVPAGLGGLEKASSRLVDARPSVPGELETEEAKR